MILSQLLTHRAAAPSLATYCLTTAPVRASKATMCESFAALAMRTTSSRVEVAMATNDGVCGATTSERDAKRARRAKARMTANDADAS